VLQLSPDGTLHLAYERNVDGLLQLRYLRRTEGAGWDLIGTNLSDAADGDATSPGLLATGAGEVTVFFTGHPQGLARFNVRRRRLDAAPPPVAVEPPAPLVASATLRAFPNPLRAGASLAFQVPGAPSGAAVDVFDLGGRRVASATLGGSGVPGVARIDGAETRAWRAGVYFARARSGGDAARIVILR
jgi:hypothetical protein